MTKTHYPQFCALARAAEIVGERWTLLIVRELLLGPKRFGDLVERLSGVSPTVLTGRLNALIESGIVRRAALPAAEKKAQRESLAAGPLSYSLDHLQRRLVAHGGEYFADGRLTVADLKVFVWIRHLKSGQLDHVSIDLPDRVAPQLVEHSERVKKHPAVKAYYAERKVAI